jgi:phospholipid-binding lipoprotein MlaA
MMNRRFVALAMVAAASLLTACAEVPTDPDEKAEFNEINDPLEPMNRAVFDVNMFLDNNVMVPVATTYRDNTPERVQSGVHNVLVNMEAPYVAGNDLLQGNPRRAADALGRFVINSTFGVLGIFDVMGDEGVKAHENDIGVTFGVWGMGEGPYLMLPLVGPSNPRDGAGRVADFWADPTSSVLSAKGLNMVNNVSFGADLVDSRTRLLDPLAEVKRSSIDLYAAIRSLYRQRRGSMIAGADAVDPVPASLPGTGVPPSERPAPPSMLRP